MKIINERFFIYLDPTIMHHPERGVASDRVDVLVSDLFLLW